MANVFDVAEYILSKTGPLPAIKLQKLVYYSQAWSLVWDGRALFPEQIQAWVNGPVVPELYQVHRLQYEVSGIARGNSAALSQSERDTVDGVLQFYGDKTPQWLSDLTHAEGPWQSARRGVGPLDRSSNEISLRSMAEYYSSLQPK